MRPLAIMLVLLLLPTLSWANGNSLSPATYNTLNEIQEWLSNKDFAKADAALQELQEALEPGFGLALTHQLHGQLYLLQDDSEKALGSFRKALNLNVLSPAQEAGIATTVAQILLSLNKPEDAYAELEPRLQRILEQERSDNDNRRHKRRDKRGADADGEVRYVQPHSMVVLATSCQMRKRYNQSIPWLRKALKRTDSPKESWLLMLMVALYQEKQYDATAQVLDDLIRLNPGKEDYWQQQAAVYQLLERPALALRTLELGYAGGYVQKPDSVLLLVQLLIAEGIPERAARILHRHLQDKTIELNERNWRILAAAWQQGRERDKATEAMHMAAALMDDGSLYFRSAQLQLQDADYRAALKDAETAMAKGLNDSDKARALMLAASSAYELSDLATARRYFQQALSYADTAANARSWLDYIAAIEQYQGVALAYE